jgi:hypothetical protein
MIVFISVLLANHRGICACGSYVAHEQTIGESPCIAVECPVQRRFTDMNGRANVGREVRKAL